MVTLAPPVSATRHIAAGMLGAPMVSVEPSCTECGFPLAVMPDGTRPCTTSWCSEQDAR